MNALHFATLYGQADIPNFLLRNRNTCQRIKSSATHPATHGVYQQQRECNERTLEQTELDCRNRWGDTSLSIATYSMHLHVAVLLVEAHTDLDMKSVDRSLQALFFEAIELNSVGAVRVLINKGVDLLGRNEMGEMALQVALRSKYGEMERVFVRARAAFEARVRILG